MWWKKNKWKVIIPVLILAVLASAFYFGGNVPGARGWKVGGDRLSKIDTTMKDEHKPAASQTEKPEESPILPETPEPSGESEETPSPTPVPKMEINPDTGKDKYQTDPVPEGKPLPVEPENAAISSTAYTCTISISCATILNNMDILDPEKEELVPEDGWILKAQTVTFYEGESVFNVLQRVCKQMDIHMEFEHTPIYNSAYIEAINNLYEFDVGEHSGWMYNVNGWFPNYGASRYQVKNGDVINWVYTCDLGYDVGGGYITG